MISDPYDQMRRAEADLEAGISQVLMAALREMDCPYPARGRPGDDDVAGCFDSGNCGCVAGAAIREVLGLPPLPAEFGASDPAAIPSIKQEQT